MQPEFARVVDPIFAYVLNLLSRIEDPAQPTPTPEEERMNIGKQFSDAESRLPKAQSSRSQWELSKYALTVWTDEVLISSPSWEGAKHWENNPLEMDFFNSNLAARRFYEQANEARRTSCRESLEVYYLAVMLGFQGFYASPGAEDKAHELGLPPDRESWAREIGRLITPTPVVEFSGARRDLGDCDPLLQFPNFLGTLLLSIVMAGAASIVAWYTFTESAESSVSGDLGGKSSDLLFEDPN